MCIRDSDDGDGLSTLSELGENGEVIDTDGDTTPDYLDLDSDGDGVADAVDPDPRDRGGDDAEVDTSPPPGPDYGFGFGCNQVGGLAFGGWWLGLLLLGWRTRR